MSVPIPLHTGREGLAGGSPSLEAEEPAACLTCRVCSPWLRCDQMDSLSILLLLPCLALPQHELSPHPEAISTDKPFSVLSGLDHSNNKVTKAKGNDFLSNSGYSESPRQGAFRVYFSPASLPESSKPPLLSGLFYRSLTDF